MNSRMLPFSLREVLRAMVLEALNEGARYEREGRQYAVEWVHRRDTLLEQYEDALVLEIGKLPDQTVDQLFPNQAGPLIDTTEWPRRENQ